MDRPGRPGPGGSGPHRPAVGECWSAPSPGWPAAASAPKPAGSCSGSASAWCSSPVPARCSPPSPWSAPTTATASRRSCSPRPSPSGIAVPLLVFAVLGPAPGRADAVGPQPGRPWPARSSAPCWCVTALVIGLNLTDGLQRALPGYTNALQSHIEGNASATQALGQGQRERGHRGRWPPAPRRARSLQECGAAPAIAGISHWLNTPGDRPLTLAGLQGTGGAGRLLDLLVHQLPAHAAPPRGLEPRLRRRRADHHRGPHPRVRLRARDVATWPRRPTSSASHYPIALDNNYTTWNAYKNKYWPAEYLIDATGHVRHVDFGEGKYGQTESFIRQLLVAADPEVAPARAHRRAPT